LRSRRVLGYWLERLREYHVSAERAPERFGEEVIRLADTHGMLLELIASSPDGEIQPWTAGPVPAEYSIRGIHSVSAALQSHEGTATLLTDTFGYRLVQETGNRFRFAASDGGGAGRTIDLIRRSGSQSGRLGAGSVHHIAFRVPDDAQQNAWRESLVTLDPEEVLKMPKPQGPSGRKTGAKHRPPFGHRCGPSALDFAIP
jgi:glyoxalase family protein